ncbi:AcvB/VirJ family lysyl-phosphatidylglycerol hydrolase [Corallococcus sp. M7]
MRRRARWFLLGAVLVLALISGARMCAAPSVAPGPVAVPVPQPTVAPRVETLRLGGRLGHVTVVTPPGRPGTVVLLLADGPAEKGRALELSMALASHGARVLGVDAGPGKEAEFEVHVTDIFGGKGRPTAAVLPDVQALKGTPVLCVYGDEELSDSLCPTLSGVPGARAVLLKGGHHFDGNSAAITRSVLRELGMALP